jgi:hypothetical protein
MDEELVDYSKDPLEGHQIWTCLKSMGRNPKFSLSCAKQNESQPLEEEPLKVLDSIIRDIDSRRRWMSNGTVDTPLNSLNLLDDFNTRGPNGVHGSELEEDHLIYALSEDVEVTNH